MRSIQTSLKEVEIEVEIGGRWCSIEDQREAAQK